MQLIMVMDNCNILLRYTYIKWIIKSTKNIVTTTTIEKVKNTTSESINDYSITSDENAL